MPLLLDGFLIFKTLTLPQQSFNGLFVCAECKNALNDICDWSGMIMVMMRVRVFFCYEAFWDVIVIKNTENYSY